MKTPEQSKKNLPEELDTELKNLSQDEVAGLREVWDLAAEPARSNFPDSVRLGNIWAAIESQAEAGTATKNEGIGLKAVDRPPVNKKRYGRLVYLNWAIAAVFIICAVALGVFFTPLTVTAPLGETASVTLKDGSVVELNSGSTLRYARRFSNERRVFLDGEAYFDVAREGRPFFIETFNSSVQVLGTKFNVKAWGSENKTVVALQSGSVRVEDINGTRDGVTLVPGQTVRVDVGDMMLSEPDNAKVTSSMAWRSGDLFFSEERLATVLDEIERRFDTGITLADESIGNRLIIYSHKNPQSAEVVLEELCISLGLHVRASEQGFEIYNLE